jgi:micrococcal nuclease
LPLRTTLFAPWIVAIATLCTVACRDPIPLGGDGFGVPMTDGADSDAVADTGGPPDSAMLRDGGCAPPADLSPSQLPAGYLRPEVVRFARGVDGDTAHFTFPSGEQIVRFLYVNTEESHGDRTTDFGIATASIVEGYLNNAHEIVVAVREDTQTRGQPDLDPYGRWLGLVFVDGTLFETRLVREGLSAYYTQFDCAPPPIHNALVYAEAEAWANLRGIWAPGHPTDYRAVFADWIGTRRCRPNPYEGPYCR